MNTVVNVKMSVPDVNLVLDTLRLREKECREFATGRSNQLRGELAASKSDARQRSVQLAKIIETIES